MSQHPNKESLSKQNVFYKMYLIRNINSIKKEELEAFLSEGWIFITLLEEFKNSFESFIGIELIYELIRLSETAIKQMQVPLESDDILICMKNLLGFVIASHGDNHSDYKEKKKIDMFSILFTLL